MKRTITPEDKKIVLDSLSSTWVGISEIIQMSKINYYFLKEILKELVNEGAIDTKQLPRTLKYRKSIEDRADEPSQALQDNSTELESAMELTSKNLGEINDTMKKKFGDNDSKLQQEVKQK